jgi:hypothetical protein
MMRAMLAEWTKFRTIRSTSWTLLAATVITVALGASLLAGILQRYDQGRAGDLDPAGQGIWLHGLNLGQVILAVLGVLLATGEYGAGTIRATLAAIPNRTRVLAAKIVGIGGLGLVLGAVLALLMVTVAQPMLASRGLTVPVTDPTAWRGIGLAGVATAGVALLGLGTGLLIRHTAGAVTTLLVIMLGVPIVEQFFPDNWQIVLRYLPAQSAWAMFTPNEHWLALGPATAVLAGWVLAVVGAAAIIFHLRDA